MALYITVDLRGRVLAEAAWRIERCQRRRAHDAPRLAAVAAASEAIARSRRLRAAYAPSQGMATSAKPMRLRLPG